MNFEEQPSSAEITKSVSPEKEKYLTAEEITRIFLHLDLLREKLPGEDPKLQLIISIWLDRKSYRDSVKKQEDKYKKEKNLAGENKLIYIDILRRLILRKSPLAEEAVGLAHDHLNTVISDTAKRLKLAMAEKAPGNAEKINFEKKFLNKNSELRKDLERLIANNYPELRKKISEKTKAAPEEGVVKAEETIQPTPAAPEKIPKPDKKPAEARPSADKKNAEDEEREEKLSKLGFVKSTGRDYVFYSGLEKAYGWNDGLGMAKKKFESLGVKVKYPNEAEARQILTREARDLLTGHSVGCYLKDEGKFMLVTNTAEKGLVFKVRDVFSLGKMPEYRNSDESIAPVRAFVVGK